MTQDFTHVLIASVAWMKLHLTEGIVRFGWKMFEKLYPSVSDTPPCLHVPISNFALAFKLQSRGAKKNSLLPKFVGGR